jgi:putative ABC transport system permease protein
MGTFLQDLRFAVRGLRKAPAFPLAAIATLALGIGATTAIFSTVSAVLLKPLPYPNPSDLYGIRTTLTDGRVTTGMLSPAEVVRLADAPSIAASAGVQSFDLTLLLDDGTPTHTQVYAVSEHFFDVFGLPFAVGPGFTPEQLTVNGPPTVVISHRMWKTLYNSDPAVVGKAIHFAEVTPTIAGVANPAFDTPHGADFWFGQRLDPQGVGHNLDGFMRLKPGTSLARAESEMSSVMAGLAKDFPASDLNRIYVVRPMVASIVGDLGPILIIVMSATAVLLLLACVNVTNLLLARGAARAREIAVRVSLGAGRGRIVRQLLTESVLLATAGAAAGLVVAKLGVRALLALGASKLPRLESVPFDMPVLLFAVVALVVSGLLVGFAPALRLARTDVRTLLNESGRSSSGGRGTARWLSAMTVIEVALAIVLVAGAGWLVRGFAALRATDLGFATEHRLTFDVALQPAKYPNAAALVAGSRDLLDRLRSVPGVGTAAFTSAFPLRGGIEASLLTQLHGQTADPADPRATRQRIVSTGFFDAMGTKVLAGRDFTADDRPDTQNVAIVNRTFARKYLTDRDPLGVQFAAGYPAIDPQNEVTVVGVVEDIRQQGIADEPQPAFYTVFGQAPFGLARRLTVVVSTPLEDMGPLQAAIRAEVRKIDPQMAVDFQLVRDLVGDTISRQQLGMTLMLIFGAVAVLLAAVGIYGVVAYAVSQRRDEVATRRPARGARHRHRPGNRLRLRPDCLESNLRNPGLRPVDARHGHRARGGHRRSGDDDPGRPGGAAQPVQRAAPGVRPPPPV